mgnify:CR=1 FL=1
MENILFQTVKKSNVLTKELKSYLLESMDYTSISFINTAVDLLQLLKIRVERGDRIIDEETGNVYTKKEFEYFVKKNFSDYIYHHVYLHPKKEEKIYFKLEECEGGYNLLLTEDGKQPTYAWISSLSERFSLVYMRATGIVYIKNVKTGNYSPFISKNGKYCRYDLEQGKLLEI